MTPGDLEFYLRQRAVEATAHLPPEYRAGIRAELYRRMKTDPAWRELVVLALGWRGDTGLSPYDLYVKHGLSCAEIAANRGWSASAVRAFVLFEAGGCDYTPEQWDAVCARIWADGCAYCGASDDGLTRDHVVPVKAGGTNDASNLVPACRSCNSRKSDTLLEDWCDGEHAEIAALAQDVAANLDIIMATDG